MARLEDVKLAVARPRILREEAQGGQATAACRRRSSGGSTTGDTSLDHLARSQHSQAQGDSGQHDTPTTRETCEGKGARQRSSAYKAMLFPVNVESRRKKSAKEAINRQLHESAAARLNGGEPPRGAPLRGASSGAPPLRPAGDPDAV